LNQDFRIGLRLKDAAFGLEFTAQITKIVDLAVHRKPNMAGLTAHGLVTGITEINNRKPAVTKHDVTGRV